MDKESVTDVVKVITLVVLGIMLVILIVMAALIRHTDYIREKPFNFLLELVAFGVLTATPIFLVAYNRKSSYKRATRDFVLLALKFMVFWVLTELAGVNSVLFPMKKKALLKLELKRQQQG